MAIKTIRVFAEYTSDGYVPMPSQGNIDYGVTVGSTFPETQPSSFQTDDPNIDVAVTTMTDYYVWIRTHGSAWNPNYTRVVRVYPDSPSINSVVMNMIVAVGGGGTSIGGGSGVNYYLNGGTSQGIIDGSTYYEMSKTPVEGSGVDFFKINTTGFQNIAQFVTDANDPALLNIPAGNWPLGFYFSASDNSGNPKFYAEIYKLSSAGIFTLLGSNVSTPEVITNRQAIDFYISNVVIPETALLVTDRIAIRIFVNTDGNRQINLHTQDSHLSSVGTTFTRGLTAINGLIKQVQFLAIGNAGSDAAIVSSDDTHTINLPTASATKRGLLNSTDWSTFNAKQPALSGSGFVKISGSTISYDNSTYQPLDEDLTAIGALAGTSGILKKTGANTWELDTSVYLTTSVAASTYQRLDKMVSNLLASDTEYPNSNAVLAALALKANATNPTFSGYLTISGGSPKIYLTDTDNNPDYFIGNDDGYFRIYDQTNTVSRFYITNLGVSTFPGDVIVGTIAKSGGTASQFLKADGTVDSNTYATTTSLANYLTSTTAASTYQRLDKMVSNLLASDTEYPNSNAVLAKLALKADAANPSFTGSMNISGAESRVNFYDENAARKYFIGYDGGFLRIFQDAGSASRFYINSSGKTFIPGTLEVGTIIKTSGLATEFLKADGTIDSNTYALNSALSNYLLSATAGTTYQTLANLSTDLTASTTKYPSVTAVNNGLATKQPLDADLTAIAALTGTSGLLKKTAADTWTLDTAAYITSSALADYLLSTDAATIYQRKDKMVSNLLASDTEYPNSNAVLAALALKANAANPTFTGDFTISGATPRLYFVDTDNNPDYTLFTDSGYFYIYNQTAGSTKFSINPSGDTIIAGALSGTGATFSSSVTTLGLCVSGYGALTNSASKFNLDFYNGNTRFYSLGANTTTKGGYEFHTNSSDGSLDVIALGISSNGAATFSSSVTATSFIGSLTGNVTGNVSGSAGSVAWSGVTGKPTTLSGYGITDAVKAIYLINTPMTTTGDWIAMSTTSGISGWTHVLNMAWSGDSQDNWVSQLAFAVQTGTGAYYRTNSGGIGSVGWTRLLDDTNYSSYALPLSGGTVTGIITNTTAYIGYRAQSDGTSAIWRGIIGSYNATADIATFIGNYAGRSGIFGHTNSMGAWNTLRINTLGIYGMGKVILSNNTVVNADASDTEYALIHAGNVSTYAVVNRSQSNWGVGNLVIDNVVGLLAWKNYGNSHVIFDASAGTSPSGTGVSQTNATYAWTASYPTLMGWNGANTYGVRVDSARIADSASSVAWSNISSKPSSIFFYEGFTLNADTMSTNASGFTYAVNAPYTGPIMRVGDWNYALQFNASYSGGGTQLAFRTRNGDAGSHNPWRVILNDSNYNSYSPTLTGSGASGSWGINITGSANSVTHLSGRTDSSSYNVVWAAGNPSLLYSCDAVRIYSSSGTLTATNLNADNIGTFGNNSSGNTGVGIYHVSNLYGRIRFYNDGTNNSTIHAFGTSWVGGVSQGYINIDGQNGVNIGGWNDPDFGVVKGGTTTVYRALNVNGGGTHSGTTYFVGNGNTGSASGIGLNVYSSNGSGAIMAFHRGGYYAINMGLDSDNVFRIGGWSAAANRWTLDMSGNQTVAGSSTATAFYESSDSRLKDLLHDDIQVKNIENLKAKLYIKNGREEYGYFAQEAETYMPSAVTKNADGYLNLSYREVHTAKIARLEQRVAELEKQLNVA